MANTVQARIPTVMFNDIMRIKRRMERETKERFGKKKPVTFVKAANEYHKRRNKTIFGGGLI